VAWWNRIWNFVGFGLAAALLVGVVIAVADGVDDLIDDSHAVATSHRFLQTVRSAYAEVRDAEASQRGFLLTGSEEYLVEFYASQPAAMRILGQLGEMVGQDPAQSQEVSDLTALVAKRIALLDQVAATRTRSGFAAALEQLQSARGSELMEQIAQHVYEIERSERARLQRRSERSNATAQRLRTFAVSGVALSLLVLVLVFGLLLRENRARTKAQQAEIRVRQRLEQSLAAVQRASEELQELSRFGGMLQSCRSVLEAILLSRDSLARLLPQMSGSIYLADPQSREIRLQAQFGRPVLANQAVMQSEDCWALRRGQSYTLEHLNADTKCPHISGPAVDLGVSTICIPLIAQGRTLGLVSLSGSQAGAGLDRLELARAATEQLSLCLFNLQLQESLHAQSIKDPLTGLYNRRYLEEALEKEIARCRRAGKPLAVAMCDIDHFKPFNDTYGHDGGDALLKAFAVTLQQGARREDVVCRYGGEEFTLILPETDGETARRRLEQLREAVAAMRVEHLGEMLERVTVSIGLALLDKHGGSPPELLRAADGALYRAKASGRNRVETAADRA